VNVTFLSKLVDFELDNVNKIQKWLEKVTRNEKRKLGDITYIFVSEKEIIKINKVFLKHTFKTDVISFDTGFLNTVSGEIYICIQVVRDYARSNQIEFNEELMRVIVHGLLHLIGYEDSNAEEKVRMSYKEDLYLGCR
jgi:probable rRNA maturation factor